MGEASKWVLTFCGGESQEVRTPCCRSTRSSVLGPQAISTWLCEESGHQKPGLS
jgi:hypothetical protein